jgi:predicted phosphodiesterase
MRKHIQRRDLFLCALLVVLLSISASARNLDGTLNLILRPISTLPAIVRAGEKFEVTVAADAPLTQFRVTLSHGRMNQVVVWDSTREQPPLQPKEGTVTVQAAVPQDTAPGLYSLSVRLDPMERRDTSERAVKVVAEWPETYSFAHITDVHIGREGPPLLEEIVKRTAFMINSLGVDFVLVTGDITDGGKPDQFLRFLQLLDFFEAPTFVTPGNHDRGEGAQAGSAGNIYERYCGPGNYTFDLGRHRYLCLDTRWEPGFRSFAPYSAWLDAQLQRPNPSMGIVFTHKPMDRAEYPYYEEQLPAHNYGLYVYGHTHHDSIRWIGAKRLMMLNASEEFMGTFDVVRIAGDQVVSIDHFHRAFGYRSGGY